MKLAEALLLRVDLQKKLRMLESRMARNAKVQEGERPSEEPLALLDDLHRCIQAWEEMVIRINRTNSMTASPEGISIADMIIRRDAIQMKLRALQQLSEAATIELPRHMRTEIAVRSAVNVADLQKQIDALSKAYREIDTQLQALNWTVELL